MRDITKHEICALGAVERRAAFNAMDWKERQKLPLGFCGNPDALFPAVLAEHIEVDRDGFVQFDYVMAFSSADYRLERMDEQLRSALRHRRAKDRLAAVKQIADDLASRRAERNLTRLWWSAHIDALEAKTELGRGARRS